MCGHDLQRNGTRQRCKIAFSLIDQIAGKGHRQLDFAAACDAESIHSKEASCDASPS
jgi:hypothetical protein